MTPKQIEEAARAIKEVSHGLIGIPAITAILSRYIEHGKKHCPECGKGPVVLCQGIHGDSADDSLWIRCESCGTHFFARKGSSQKQEECDNPRCNGTIHDNGCGLENMCPNASMPKQEHIGSSIEGRSATISSIGLDTQDPMCECGEPRSKHTSFVRKDASKPLGIEPNGRFCPEPPHSSRVRLFKQVVELAQCGLMAERDQLKSELTTIKRETILECAEALCSICANPKYAGITWQVARYSHPLRGWMHFNQYDQCPNQCPAGPIWQLLESQPSTAKPDPFPWEALRSLLDSGIETGIGEHDMCQCRFCGIKGENAEVGHAFGIKHAPGCAWMSAYDVVNPNRKE